MAISGPLESSLSKLIIQSYEGEKSLPQFCDDEGYYQGKGHAVFKDGRIYTGDFLNGRMHGVGSYEWPDGTKYEGNFFHNKITGKGKYIWSCGSVYEGSVVDGLRHGYGIFQSTNKVLRYEGNWENGKRSGKGVLFYDEHHQVFYDGDWKEGLRHGKGKMKYSSGNIYDGQWQNDKKHGYGIMNWYDLHERYSGMWNNDLQDGKGDHVWLESPLTEIPGAYKQMLNHYRGMFFQGKRHGIGTFYYANGAKYCGQFVENMKEGYGIFIFEDGNIYEGPFHKDRMIEFNSNYIKEERNNHIACKMKFNLDDIIWDGSQNREINNVFLLLNTDLKSIYRHYSCHGNQLRDHFYTMDLYSMWRFCNDCGILDATISLGMIFNIFQKMKEQQINAIRKSKYDRSVKCEENTMNSITSLDEVLLLKDDDDENRNSFSRLVLYREFVEALIRIANHKMDLDSTFSQTLSAAFLRFYEEDICNKISKSAKCNDILTLIQQPEIKQILEEFHFQLLDLYEKYTDQDEEFLQHLTTRQFVTMLQDYNVIQDNFSLSKAIQMCNDCAVRSIHNKNQPIEDMDALIVYEEFLQGFVMIAQEIYPNALNSREAIANLLLNYFL